MLVEFTSMKAKLAMMPLQLEAITSLLTATLGEHWDTTQDLLAQHEAALKRPLAVAMTLLAEPLWSMTALVAELLVP
jgi:hypothetical protein